MLKLQKSPTDSEVFEIYQDWSTSSNKDDKLLWATIHSDIYQHLVDQHGKSIDVRDFLEALNNRGHLNIKLMVDMEED